MGIAVLGPLAVDGATGRLRHHDRVVLAVLAMRPGEPVSAERLADALWAEALPGTWSKVVQGCVMRLRKALGPESIETTPHGYRLTLPPDQVDSARFERLVARGRELLALAEPERAAFVIDEAVALWRGPALADLDGWDGCRAETTRLEELRRSAEELGLDAALKAGHATDVLGRAQQLVEEAPLRERRWVLLALAQYQAGLQADALRTLRDVRTVLATELGVDPGPELVALEKAILLQEPTLTVTAAAPAPSPTCPYRGLLPFGVSDGDTFFGRDEELHECLRRLSAHGVLAVVGPSGSGKSSLVQAGVAAALTRDGRRVRVVTPGNHPLDALDGTPPSAPLPVLVVDQCEEVVTLCESAAERAEFLDRLAAHAGRAPLVLALRADQLGTLSSYTAFARVLEQGLFLLGPMGPDQLRACIERPAAQAGLLLEHGLVDLLLHEVEDEPGALPMLSHALRQTWTHREGRTLTVAGYHASGGIRGAVARTAEDVHDNVPPQDRPLLRALMLRLVTEAPDGQPVRTRVPRRVLVRDEVHAAIVERLVNARLLVSDGEDLELAHEALIRAWPRLRQWLADDAAGQRILHHLTTAADTWDSMERPESELYRGVRLAQALDWRQQSAPELTAVEEDFLVASQALVDAELREARQRASTERRARRRTRRLAMGLAAVLVLALVAAGSATWFQQEASDRADEADANRLAALSKSVRSIDQSLLLAAQALRTADTPATRDGLLSSLLEHGRAERVLRLGNRTLGGALANGGRTLFVNANSQLFAWDLGSSEPPRTISRWGDKLDVIAGAPTADLVVLSSWKDDETPVVGVLDSQGRERLLLDGMENVGGAPSSFGFSPDSSRLYLSVFARDDESPGPQGVYLREFDIATGELMRNELVQRRPAAADWMSAMTSDDGAWSVSWDTFDPRSAVLVENRSGRRVPLTVSRKDAEPATFFPVPNGTALAWDDGTVSLLDATGTETQALEAHRVEVDDVVVAPDGSWAAIGDGSGLMTIWDIDPRSGSWSPRETLSGPEGGLSLSVGADSATLVSVSTDGTVVVWDLADGAGLASEVPGLGARRWISNTPAELVAGRLVVAPTRGGPADAVWWTHDQVSATFLDPRTGEVVDQVPVGRNRGALLASSVSVSPDRSLVAVTHQVGTVVLDARTREEVARITLDDMVAFGERMPENVWCTAWTPDGSKLLLCAEGEEYDAEDGNLVVVDTGTWEVAAERIDVGGSVQSVELSPDGDLFALGMVLQIVDDAPPGLVKLVDSRTLEVVREIELGTDHYPFDVSFSPDGSRLAVGVDTGLVFVADVATGKLVREPTHAHSSFVGQVEWLPDNRTVVSAGFDTKVTLYDADRGLVRATMPVALEDVDDGHTYLLSADRDGVGALTRQKPGRTYPLDPEVLLDRACAVAGRDLTRDEWASYLPGRPYERTCTDRG